MSLTEFEEDEYVQVKEMEAFKMQLKHTSHFIKQEGCLKECLNF